MDLRWFYDDRCCNGSKNPAQHFLAGLFPAVAERCCSTASACSRRWGRGKGGTGNGRVGSGRHSGCTGGRGCWGSCSCPTVALEYVSHHICSWLWSKCVPLMVCVFVTCRRASNVNVSFHVKQGVLYTRSLRACFDVIFVSVR